MNENEYIPRLFASRLQELIKHFPSVVITGARQVGKTTLLKHIFPNYDYVLFDPVVDVESARSDPDLFLDNHPTPLILDEIQFAPELVPAVKRRIDKNKKPGMYILTGSQQWGVLNQVSESLAGRAIICQLDPFSLAEITKPQPEKYWLEEFLNTGEIPTTDCMPLPFNTNELLWRGLLPETLFLPKELITQFHASYQATYIEKDIRLLEGVRDLQLFSRFVKLIAAHTASEINYNELGREIDITPQTAKRWLNLLIQTFEWFEIPPFSRNQIKKVSGKSKGYFADTGQVCFSQMVSSPVAIASHPLKGKIFENGVVVELKKRLEFMQTPPRLYHWRLHSGSEVDLILERDGKFTPIEIKMHSSPKKKDARGINAFRKCYSSKLNITTGFVIAPSSSVYPIEKDVYVVPWNQR